MKKRSLNSLLLLLSLAAAFIRLASPMSVYASTPPELYNEGNSAYSKSEYAKAFELYAKALEMGANDPDLYFNIGNASYKTKKTGLAVLYYKKALRLAPGDRKIAENLKFVRSELRDKIDEPEKGVITALLGWCFRRTTLNGFFVAALVPYLLISAMLFFMILDKKNLTKPILLLVPLLMFFTLFLSAKIYDERLSDPEGVVVIEVITARSEPRKDGEVVFTIHEGTLFEINEEHGEWQLVTLPAGWSGWVNRKGTETI